MYELVRKWWADFASVYASAMTAASLVLSGDIEAAGGMRRMLGPWSLVNVAQGQAAASLLVGGLASGPTTIAVPRAGSVVGISVSSSAAITAMTADGEIVFQVQKNGTDVVGCLLNLTEHATNLGRATTFATPASLTPTGSADLVVTLEVEC
jgi:hypothetical protein